MTSMTSSPREISLLSNMFRALSFVGSASADDGSDNIAPVLIALLLIVALWVVAVVNFGVVALYLPMVVLSPICLIALVIISRG